MNYILDYLANHTDKIPQVAEWLYDEWGYLRGANYTLAERVTELQQQVNKIKLPIHILALQDDQAIGIAALKPTEMKQYPLRKNWLGSLFVVEEHRGKGVATALEKEICQLAQVKSINTLYLQTEDLKGGLYRRLGWKALDVVEQEKITVLVMEKNV